MKAVEAVPQAPGERIGRKQRARRSAVMPRGMPSGGAAAAIAEEGSWRAAEAVEKAGAACFAGGPKAAAQGHIASMSERVMKKVTSVGSRPKTFRHGDQRAT